MIRIFLISILLVCCICVGFLISNYFKKRKQFFAEMLSFLEFLKNYIKSCSEKLSVVAVKYNSCENSFSYLLSEFLDFIENKKTKEDFWVFIEDELNFLKEEEKLQIFDIFTTMGEFDEYGELSKLEFKKKIIEEKFKKIVGENNKFSPFFIKISIVVACFLFLVFI